MERHGVLYVQVECKKHQLIIRSFHGGFVEQESSISGSRFVETNDDGDDTFGIADDPSDSFSGVFDLKFLTHCTKSTSLSDRIFISMRNDHPLLLEYPISTFGHLRCLLFSTRPTTKTDDE